MANPELFACNPKDDAFHRDPSPGFFEWWYFDAFFDDQSSFVISWHVDGMGADGHIIFAAYDQAGKKTEASATFPASVVSVSETTCDVRMGGNYVTGQFPRWEMHFCEGGLGCDLVFQNLTQGVRTPPDGVTTRFSEDPPRYIAWVVAQPRADVSGELTVGSNTFKVHGVGYHDHNWGVGQGTPGGGAAQLSGGGLGALFDHWYWGRLYLPAHTLVYTVGRAPEALGKFPILSLVALRGESLVTFSGQVDYEEKDLRVDEASGAQYPLELVIKPRHRRIQGELALKLRKIIEIHPHGERGHAYLRFLADCHAKLDFDGERIETVVPAIHELMRP